MAVVVALCVALVAATTAFVLRQRSVQQAAQRAAERSSSAAPTTSLTPLLAGPRIVFRESGIGPDYGRVAVIALADPGGPRAYTSLACDRVFATRADTLCLASDRGLVTTYSATVVDADGTRTAIPLTGSPSRARLSADGALAATTSFVAGDSYAATSFSTRTVVTHLADRSSVDLEDFTLVDGGQRVAPSDRNYWGVTFAADDDRFFVTVKFAGTTHLAEGRLSTRTVTTLRTDAECPSLSPDGTKVAYKKLGDRGPGDWRLAVLDLASGRETALAEQQRLDDQVEWLDDDHVLYGLPGQGTRAGESDVWVVPADGSGSPRVLVHDAWSPAVVR
ncbi:PD40 domain-containing protein [Lapillicoccus jejuensis]|uniref:WD40 repeat protein n=1 Tax=Lapillicoccus jejuensis TaxID=402171 RepID=A0A542E1D7_9MICO|nr:hypothetical protein FB458_2264 [Lapillicoccus jejuensis]